ncbi:hypothetical protein GCM10009795_013680 [Nocardioides hankookensis]
MTGANPRLVLGSSSEGREMARHLQAELSADVVEIVRWDQSVFEAGWLNPRLLAGQGLRLSGRNATVPNRPRRTATDA